MKVTSVEFQRGFGRYRAVARREPVLITHHGRDDLVLLAAEDYLRLNGEDTGLAAIAAEIDAKTRAAVSAFADKVMSRYGVIEVILFGSRARSTHRADSDADVAVVLRGQAGDFLETKLAMADLAYDVLLETGIRVQPLPIWEGAWTDPDSHANPELLRNVQREGIRI